MLSRVNAIALVTLLSVALMMEAAVSRKRRGGGWNKVAVTEPEVQAVAAKAAAHIEKAKFSVMRYRLQEVTSAKYQIVQGKNFELTLRIGQTPCLRRAKVDEKNCPIFKVERCAVTAYVWQGKTEIKKFSCKREKNTGDGGGGRQSTGGEIDIDVNREDVHEAAIFATAELARQGGHQMELVRVTNASVQVVTGARYRMTMIVKITEAEFRTETDTCKVKVLDQPWRTPRYTLEDHTCLLG